jgi:hypothetical protein
MKYYTESRKKGVDWIGHTAGRNCLLKDVIQGKTDRRK